MVFYVNGLITIWIFLKYNYYHIFILMGLLICFFEEISLLKERIKARRKVGYV